MAQKINQDFKTSSNKHPLRVFARKNRVIKVEAFLNNKLIDSTFSDENGFWLKSFNLNPNTYLFKFSGEIFAVDKITLLTNSKEYKIQLSITEGNNSVPVSQTVSQPISISLSNEVSARVESDQQINAKIELISNSFSVLTSRIEEVSSLAASGGSNEGITTAELSSTADNVLSIAYQDTLSAVNIVSNSLSVEIASRISADALLSNLISNIISAGGGGISVTSNELSAVSAQAASAINVVSNSVSIVSNALSALEVRVSVLSSTGGGSGSVTSNELSAVSAQAASAINVVSNAVSIISQQVSVLSNALSNEISNRNSAVNVASNAVSNLEVRVSTLSSTVVGLGGGWYQTSVNFGSNPTWNGAFTITNAFASTTSYIIVLMSGNSPTGLNEEEAEWDVITFAAKSLSGSFIVRAAAFPGPVSGRRKIFYLIK